MEEKYKELLKKLYAILKPLGYRKEASDYRLFRPDGLAQIVNIQRNKNNTAQCCMFTINNSLNLSDVRFPRSVCSTL